MKILIGEEVLNYFPLYLFSLLVIAVETIYFIQQLELVFPE